MPRNTALLALSGLFLVGLVGGGASVLGVGEAPAPTAPSPAPIKQINGNGIVLGTSSTSTDLRSPDAPTPSVGSALVDQPCENVGPVAAFPATTDLEVFRAYRARTVSVAEEPAGPFCAMVVGLGVAQNEPATGSLLLSRTTSNGAADPASPPAAIQYTVKRLTPLSTFLEIAGWAALIGLFAALTIYSLLRRSSLLLPGSYEYGKPWASTVASVTAVVSSLLAGGGVLVSFAPQYQMTGIAVANIIVAAGIAVAPAIVAVSYAGAGEKGKRYSLAVAGGVTVASIAGQIGLDALYVLHTDLSAGAHTWVTHLGGALFLLLASYVVIALASLPGTGTPTT